MLTLDMMEEDVGWREASFGFGFGFHPSMTMEVEVEPSSSSQPPVELSLSRDTHFALHGQIWLLVVLLVFALVFASIVFLPRLSLCKRSSESEEEEEEEEDSNRIKDRFPL
ncbi:hypothetical protein V6N13_144446 [Hibiscus sabdariffa]|uniref:Uncharacterized protein n=1 Tax=Hibiscus sabdariffa TaxID=183260 RepID=A0ABR2FKD9_9ROSI